MIATDYLFVLVSLMCAISGNASTLGHPWPASHALIGLSHKAAETRRRESNHRSHRLPQILMRVSGKKKAGSSHFFAIKPSFSNHGELRLTSCLGRVSEVLVKSLIVSKQQFSVWGVIVIFGYKPVLTSKNEGWYTPFEQANPFQRTYYAGCNEGMKLGDEN